MDKFSICSNALVMVGAQPITAFGDTPQEAVVARQLYQTTVDNWLSLHDWRFNMRQKQLTRLVEEPAARWSAAYEFPDECITIRQVLKGSGLRSIDYDRFERRVYCDAGPNEIVIGEYSYNISETRWPPYFVSLIELSLASKFAFPLGGKMDLAKEIGTLADKQFALAKHRDSQQQTTRNMNMRHARSIMAARLS